MNRTCCVYILASRSRNLYTGVTSDLQRRMLEHRDGLIPGFTARYRIFRLVLFEIFGDIRDAIAREKEIKAWRRAKKIWLIERHNPTWEDLAHRFTKSGSESRNEQKHIPHRRSLKAGDQVRDDDVGEFGTTPSTRLKTLASRLTTGWLVFYVGILSLRILNSDFFNKRYNEGKEREQRSYQVQDCCDLIHVPAIPLRFYDCFTKVNKCIASSRPIGL